MRGFTPGPWIVDENVGCEVRQPEGSKRRRIKCPPDHDGFEDAKLIAQAPDRHDQMLALTKYGWEVEQRLLYDEEGVEGWTWIEPDQLEHTETGDWNELPPWPDSAREALAKLEGAN